MSKVLEIDRCDLDIKSNRSNHHTELYGEKRLIVRRGEPFTVILHLKPGSRKFKPGETSFTLVVETGPLPRKESDTQVSFGLRESTLETEWSASATNDPSGNKVSVSISSSPNAPIGLYSLTLDQDGQKTSLGEFILLFNAWCHRDAVYMRNEMKRKEYVLEQHGQIYRGMYTRIKELEWNFGQFDPSILDICLMILDKNPKFIADADKDCSARRNPIYVTRVLSAMINSNDDMGVVVGSWGKVTDGVRPGRWSGSADILRQWGESGPVRYGQCWVFAAVGCTVSRALGIPCRVVTNFESAHDCNANLVIENVYTPKGEKISQDSVWNFHVWVDSWMTRPDLGPEFDGWQASDPTPQEKSDGVFCCGPVPLRAIKEGELTKKYDAPFVFAEIKLAKNMLVGSDFEVSAILTNNYMETRNCSLMFFARAVDYNGKRGDSCGFTSDKMEVPSGEEKHLSLRLEYEHYGSVITSDRLILVTATAIDKEDYYEAKKTIVLDEPDIEIKLVGEAMVNKSVTAMLTMLNPLPETLRDCSFTIEGISLTEGKPITQKIGTVGRKQEAKASIEFIPTRVGSSKLLVNFDSDKLNDIKSFIKVVVKG
ncbi:protein-glutamine gamma-glutamyltransferase 2 isoform X2 [Larimichthys crocea]|uniref:protein-glutamine gamma-glutamyltransferase 2 isoform X2 n=1 Tax=Larimichthys crocea TaxID=215358 RepID=UPI000F5D6927|nr:protein-glutamine gamma-glutamyltransferase 2-like isoform X2 [Larimichthys crocea]